MKISCKNCGNIITYNYNPLKFHSKIKCSECNKVYKLDDINYNENMYYLVFVPIIFVLITFGAGSNSIIVFIIRIILNVKLIDLIQYIFMEYSIEKYGFKE